MQWAEAFVERTGVPALLKSGFHHVTIDLYPTRMDDTGVAAAAEFQDFLVKELGFAPKANLIGMSWGGFFSIRYAAAHPGNVRRIYLDAPLLSFQRFRAAANARGIGSWFASRPSDGEWRKDPRMPVNMAGAVAKAGIPILLLYGGKDDVVPPDENCRPFAAAFKAAMEFKAKWGVPTSKTAKAKDEAVSKAKDEVISKMREGLIGMGMKAEMVEVIIQNLNK
jgi:pimeloyl-ACP methyl ester carboxylesterase